jgi:hypothetical protein
MIRRSTILAQSFRHPVIIAAVVLRFFRGREVHRCRAIITTISTGGVAGSLGAGEHQCCNGQARVIGMLGKGSMAQIR